MNTRWALLIFLVTPFVLAADPVASPAAREAAINAIHPLPQSEPAIDIRTAIQTALKNNNAILQAREKLEQDRQDVYTSRSLLFPNLSLNANAGEFKNAVGSSGSAQLGGSAYEQYSASLHLAQPLMQFGAFSAIEFAQKNIELNKYDLEISERTLSNNVIQTFYKVLLSQRLLRNLEKIQKVIDESLATAQRRQRTGRGQLLDVLQVKTQMALLKPQIEDARNQLESAGAQLATYLSQNGKYYLQLQGTLKTLLLKDVKARLNSSQAHLPELDRLKLQRDQLEDQKGITLGKHLPSLNLVGDYGALSYKRANIASNDARDWNIQLQLSIPLFSGFESLYERRSFASQDRQIEFESHDLENTLALQQVQSLKTLQSTEASLVSAQEAADLADQSFTEANRNFRLTTIDVVQFLTVQQSTLQAYSALDNITYNNIVAFANYFVATGQPLSTLVDLLEAKDK